MIIRKNYKWTLSIHIMGLFIVVFISKADISKILLANLIPVVIIITSMLTIKSIKRSFISIPIYLAVSVIDTIIGGLVALMCGYSTYLLLENKIYSFAINSTSLVIYIFIAIVFAKKYEMTLSYIKTYDNVKYTIIFTISIVGIILSFIPMQVKGLNSGEQQLRFYAAVGMAICTVIFFINSIMLLYINYKKKYYEKHIEIDEKLMMQQKEYYKEISEDKEIRKFHHDIRIIMLRLEQFIEDENIKGAKDFLSHMKGKLSKSYSGIETGNDTLNIVVNDVFGSYQEGRIPVIWKGKFPENVKMSDLDICILFSNLFKNAIESEINVHEVYNESEEEYNAIIVNINYMKKSVYITIENRVNGEVNVIGNTLKTTKQDSLRHGFGSLSIREIIKKYEGDIEYKQNESIFTVEIILYNIIN